LLPLFLIESWTIGEGDVGFGYWRSRPKLFVGDILLGRVG